MKSNQGILTIMIFILLLSVPALGQRKSSRTEGKQIQSQTGSSQAQKKTLQQQGQLRNGTCLNNTSGKGKQRTISKNGRVSGTGNGTINGVNSRNPGTGTMTRKKNSTANSLLTTRRGRGGSRGGRN